MASGVYRLNATCDDEVLNTVAADGYFSVRSRIPLSITLFPCATSSTFGNASGLQVKVSGTHGETEELSLAILSTSSGAPGVEGALGVMQWDMQALDVGDILEVEMAVPSTDEEACAKSILLSSFGSLYEAGFPEVLQGGSSQRITRQICEQYSSSCFEGVASHAQACGLLPASSKRCAC
eukprot:598715-Pelagomonas_calceolata.AAC.5